MSYCLLCENIFNTTSALKNHKNRLQGNSQKKSLWTGDGHADAAMSDSCRLMRIYAAMVDAIRLKNLMVP